MSAHKLLTASDLMLQLAGADIADISF